MAFKLFLQQFVDVPVGALPGFAFDIFERNKDHWIFALIIPVFLPARPNLFVFEKVLDILTQALPHGENVLDMYAGCGAISCFLGQNFNNVTLVEHNRDALVFAEQNMAGIAHTSYGLSGANWVKTCAQGCTPFDAAVVDPPRSGMEKEVLDYFCSSKIPFIAYLSCNPSTQSRDCAKLIKAGYKIQSCYLLDFYPNTSHIESLVTLRQAQGPQTGL